jgi:hypothetical protein
MILSASNDERTNMEDQLTCGWLVEVRNNPKPPADLSDEDYDDWCTWAGESVAEQPTLIVECGAAVHDIPDGWCCEAGHSHLYYGSDRQIAQERQEAWAELHGVDHYAY